MTAINLSQNILLKYANTSQDAKNLFNRLMQIENMANYRFSKEFMPRIAEILDPKSLFDNDELSSYEFHTLLKYSINNCRVLVNYNLLFDRILYGLDDDFLAAIADLGIFPTYKYTMERYNYFEGKKSLINEKNDYDSNDSHDNYYFHDEMTRLEEEIESDGEFITDEKLVLASMARYSAYMNPEKNNYFRLAPFLTMCSILNSRENNLGSMLYSAFEQFEGDGSSFTNEISRDRIAFSDLLPDEELKFSDILVLCFDYLDGHELKEFVLCLMVSGLYKIGYINRAIVNKIPEFFGLDEDKGFYLLTGYLHGGGSVFEIVKPEVDLLDYLYQSTGEKYAVIGFDHIGFYEIDNEIIEKYPEYSYFFKRGDIREIGKSRGLLTNDKEEFQKKFFTDLTPGQLYSRGVNTIKNLKYYMHSQKPPEMHNSEEKQFIEMVLEFEDLENFTVERIISPDEQKLSEWDFFCTIPSEISDNGKTRVIGEKQEIIQHFSYLAMQDFDREYREKIFFLSQEICTLRTISNLFDYAKTRNSSYNVREFFEMLSTGSYLGMDKDIEKGILDELDTKTGQMSFSEINSILGRDERTPWKDFKPLEKQI